MKRFSLIVVGVLILTGILFQSFVINNTTKDYKNDMCEVHKLKMKKTLVKTSYGFVCNNGNTREFPNAKAPECMGCVIPIWPIKRLAKIYHCKVCDDVKLFSQKTRN